MVADMVANMEVDMVPEMELDMVADDKVARVANMLTNRKKKLTSTSAWTSNLVRESDTGVG